MINDKRLINRTPQETVSPGFSSKGLLSIELMVIVLVAIIIVLGVADAYLSYSARRHPVCVSHFTKEIVPCPVEMGGVPPVPYNFSVVLS